MVLRLFSCDNSFRCYWPKNGKNATIWLNFKWLKFELKFELKKWLICAHHEYSIYTRVRFGDSSLKDLFCRNRTDTLTAINLERPDLCNDKHNMQISSLPRQSNFRILRFINFKSTRSYPYLMKMLRTVLNRSMQYSHFKYHFPVILLRTVKQSLKLFTAVTQTKVFFQYSQGKIGCC